MNVFLVRRGRPTQAIDPTRSFERDLVTALGARINSDSDFAAACFGALGNTMWTKGDDRFQYSHEAAAELVAVIRGEGDYRDWLGCATVGRVTPEFAHAMSRLGWTHEPFKGVVRFK